MTLPKRKYLRLDGYDYSQEGAYFITICTLEKRWLLSTIVGGGVLDAPFPQLTQMGQMVQCRIEEMCKVYTHVSVDKYVIMPNHIHMIIHVRDKMVQAGGTSRTPSPTNAVVPAFISTLKRMVNREIGHPIWQRSYNDHILHNEADYLQHWQYIDENPIKWESDEHYTPM